MTEKPIKDIRRSQLFNHPFRDDVIDLIRTGKNDVEVEEFLRLKGSPVNRQAIRRFRKALRKADPRTYVEQKLGEIRASFKAVDKHLASIRVVEKKIELYQRLAEEAAKAGDTEKMVKWDFRIQKWMYLYNRMVVDHIRAQDVIRSMTIPKKKMPEDSFEKAREKVMKQLKKGTHIKIEEE